MDLALVGLGAWGLNYVRTIEETPGVRLIAASSRRCPAPGVLPSSIAWFGDWRQMLHERFPDGLVVATPPATHAEISQVAISLGVPVLIEKPITLDLAELDELSAAAISEKVLVQVDHIDLFNPAWRAIRREIPNLGEVRRMRGIWQGVGPYRPDTKGRWDWGVHALAVALDVAGTGARLSRVQPLMVEKGELVEVGLYWDSGSTASLTFGNGGSTRMRKMEISGVKGKLEYDAIGIATAKRDGRSLTYCARQTPLQAVLIRFAAGIRGRGGVQPDDLEMSREIINLLCQIDRDLVSA